MYGQKRYVAILLALSTKGADLARFAQPRVIVVLSGGADITDDVARRGRHLLRPCRKRS